MIGLLWIELPVVVAHKLSERPLVRQHCRVLTELLERVKWLFFVGVLCWLVGLVAPVVIVSVVATVLLLVSSALRSVEVIPAAPLII